MSYSYSPKIVSNGLVLCLDAANRKSYTSGSTVWYDLSPYNNNGTCNGTTYNTNNNGSFVFNGSSNYILIPYNTIFSLTTWTLSVWVKILSTPADTDFIFGSGYDNSLVNYFIHCIGGFFRVGSYKASGNLDQSTSSLTTISSKINNWVNVVGYRTID